MTLSILGRIADMDAGLLPNPKMSIFKDGGASPTSISKTTEIPTAPRTSGVGFVPVGICALGTGDPCFINSHDGDGGPLYRIYHDEVNDENYDPSRAVAIVLEDHRELLKYTDR